MHIWFYKLPLLGLHIIDSVGMLSKAKGQILQIASVLHVLFHIDTPLEISNVIDAEAIKAAINMVDVCMQHFSWKR